MPIESFDACYRKITGTDGGQLVHDNCSAGVAAAVPIGVWRAGHQSKESRVKKLEAIVQPFKLDDVKEALLAIGVDGMTLSEVRGHGRQKGHSETYRGQEYNVDLLPKVKVEVVIPDARLEEVLTTLAAAARTGKIGDGKIFVYEVAHAIRIRNGDQGDAAI
jgi:nitrogen regulatory protein P-II 1